VFWAACSPRGERVEPWTPVTYPTSTPANDTTTLAPAHAAVPPAPSASAPLADPPEPGDSSSETEAPTPSPDGEALRRQFSGRRPKRTFVGDATYYHDSLAGNPTACGESYAPMDFTAAHRSLPFGTILRVVHPSSGGDVFVRVNDRGPFGRRGLVLDLSRAAADEVGLMRTGVMKVRVEVLEFGSTRRGKCGRSASPARDP
jgi:rare lipoprotein A